MKKLYNCEQSTNPLQPTINPLTSTSITLAPTVNPATSINLDATVEPSTSFDIPFQPPGKIFISPDRSELLRYNVAQHIQQFFTSLPCPILMSQNSFQITTMQFHGPQQLTSRWNSVKLGDMFHISESPV